MKLSGLCQDCRNAYDNEIVVGHKLHKEKVCVFHRQDYPKATHCGVFDSKYIDEMDDNQDAD